MDNKKKSILEKIELIHIVILLVIIIIFSFTYYQYSASIPKLCNDIQVQLKEELEDYYTLQSVDKDKKRVVCAIDSNYLEETEYKNYITGASKGKKVNCSIILRQKDQFYKLKTIQQKIENGKIYLAGFIKNKYLVEEYEIFLYDNENQRIYQYIGGKSEESI